MIVLFDDLGFAQLGCFGGLGGRIRTPHIDRLAAEGLRYQNFHTTALCSPSRAALLTGRNHHSVGIATITDLSAVKARETSGIEGIIIGRALYENTIQPAEALALMRA